jgi:hypothetical protein
MVVSNPVDLDAVEAASPAPMDDYLFDLQGFFVIEQAVDASHVAELSEALLAMRTVEPDGWIGNVWRLPTDHPENDVELQNIVEGGEPFERLIDHPAWIGHVRRYCGEQGSPWESLFIDECFGKIRGEGDFHRVHSGGYRTAVRTQYRYEHGAFRCGQINVLIALTDIGPGDGGTLLVPGSHKSNFRHPQLDQLNERAGRMDGMTGVVGPELRSGDALVFVDSVTHGTATRTNPHGERLSIIYRYGPGWAATRRGYTYSDELLARLTPGRRKIVQPIPPRRRPGASAPQ